MNAYNVFPIEDFQVRSGIARYTLTSDVRFGRFSDSLERPKSYYLLILMHSKKIKLDIKKTALLIYAR